MEIIDTPGLPANLAPTEPTIAPPPITDESSVTIEALDSITHTPAVIIRKK